MTMSMAGVLCSRRAPDRQRTGPAAPAVPPVCAGCRAKEARYGFRGQDTLEAPRTLCFECFRLAMAHRRERVAQLDLPFPARLREADLRRRRAQIAARRALGL